MQPEAAALGEMLRRAALGLAAALVVARPYWPAEYSVEARSGSGLLWSLLMIVAAILAVPVCGSKAGCGFGGPGPTSASSP